MIVVGLDFGSWIWELYGIVVLGFVFFPVFGMECVCLLIFY